MSRVEDITYFGRTNSRSSNKLFGMHQKDRLLHTYIIGKTGTGKTTLMQTMLMQDIQSGRGVCLLDPHGDFVEAIFKQIPSSRVKDVVYFNVPDRALNLKYNPFRKVSVEKRSLVASGMLEAFEKLWHSAWGVKLEHILRYTILTLLDLPSATMEDIPKLLLDRHFRKQAFPHIQNESVKLFWKREFPEYNKYDLLPVLNKVGGLLAHPIVKRILVDNPEEVSLRKAMDEKKIVLVNLSKGHLGEDTTKILGALFVSSLSSAAFSRADCPEEDRTPHMVYLDEFHNFTTLSLINMFSELRKFSVGMTMAHQYLHQLDDKISKAILGNAGTLISFRIGTKDAGHMEKEMYPLFDVQDFINLPNYHFYIKLMIQGRPSKPFSALSELKHQTIA